MPVFRRVFRFALFACLAFAAPVSGQEGPGKSASVLEIPYFFDKIPPFYQVVELDPRGAVRFEVRPDFRQVKPAITEGYYVLVLRPEGAPGELRLIRAQVTDVDGPVSAKLTTSPEAAGKLRKGDAFFLVRPGGSTTAQIKGLPGVIPFAGKSGEQGAQDLASALQTARLAAQRVQSVNNLKQMGLALHNYHSTMNQWPAAVIHGPDGKPWHSWRVLILPYLEQTSLYNAYDFLQPWDSEKNLKLLDKMPAVYRDPVHGDANGHFTHYAALVGTWKQGGQEVHTGFQPASARMKDKTTPIPFNDPKGSGLQNMTDGSSNTLMIAPVSPDRKIPWTKPDDIAVGADFPGLGQPGGIAAPYATGDAAGAPRVAPVLFADGSVRDITSLIKPEVLRGLCTRDGGEVISADAVPTGPGARATPPATLKIHIEGGKARAAVE